MTNSPETQISGWIIIWAMKSNLTPMHKTRLHVGQLVDTSVKLKQASETDNSIKVSAEKKITDAKLAKDFQAVLKEFQEAQWLAAEAETAYVPFVPSAVLLSKSEVGVSSDRSPEQHVLLVESRRYFSGVGAMGTEDIKETLQSILHSPRV